MIIMYNVLLAICGTTLYSAGVILQKKGAGWMVLDKKYKPHFISAFTLWLVGMLFSYALSALPIGIASKSLPPHVISALSGWSIVAVAFLSSFFLKEKLYASDVLYSFVIIGCILILSRLQSASLVPVLNLKYLNILLLFPFIFLLPLATKLTDKKQKVILLSIFSGFLSGLTLVFMNILVKEYGSSISSMLHSVNFYLYFAAGIASVAAKQAAYLLGDIVLFTPLQTSFSMIYPLLCSYLLLNMSISPIQIFLVLIMAGACWGIQRKR